jgi:hypothetical protein
VPLHHEKTNEEEKERNNVLQIFLQNQDKKEKKYLNTKFEQNEKRESFFKKIK